MAKRKSKSKPAAKAKSKSKAKARRRSISPSQPGLGNEVVEMRPMSATERRDLAKDYAQEIKESTDPVERTRLRREFRSVVKSGIEA